MEITAQIKLKETSECSLIHSGQVSSKLYQVAKGLFHPSSEHPPERWRFHHLPGQPAPALNQPHQEEFFPYAQLELPLQQLAVVASHSPAVHL